MVGGWDRPASRQILNLYYTISSYRGRPPGTMPPPVRHHHAAPPTTPEPSARPLPTTPPINAAPPLEPSSPQIPAPFPESSPQSTPRLPSPYVHRRHHASTLSLPAPSPISQRHAILARQTLFPTTSTPEPASLVLPADACLMLLVARHSLSSIVASRTRTEVSPRPPARSLILLIDEQVRRS
jgi:hypothetical protein